MGRSFTAVFSDRLSSSSMCIQIYSFLNAAPMIFFGWNDIYMFFISKICHVIFVRESTREIEMKTLNIFISLFIEYHGTQ